MAHPMLCSRDLNRLKKYNEILRLCKDTHKSNHCLVKESRILQAESTRTFCRALVDEGYLEVKKDRIDKTNHIRFVFKTLIDIYPIDILIPISIKISNGMKRNKTRPGAKKDKEIIDLVEQVSTSDHVRVISFDTEKMRKKLLETEIMTRKERAKNKDKRSLRRSTFD